jgi:quercetin dioxygenase-like cupin family protein
MFYKHTDDGFQPVLPGIQIKTVLYGENSLMSQFRLQKDSLLPRHSHPQEQTGYLVSGHMRLHIGDQAYEVHPGDGWCIPGSVEHLAEVLEDSIAIEVFSPVREDYLPENLAKKK